LSTYSSPPLPSATDGAGCRTTPTFERSASRKRADHSVFDAIPEAGLRRSCPIILTTLTTFGHLTPVIPETSGQATQLIPMAISLGLGIVFATSIILVLVPCLYMILEDVVTVAQGTA